MPEVRASWKMARTEPDQMWPLPAAVQDPQRITIPDWPEGAMTMTAELLPGRVLVHLQVQQPGGAAGSDVADLRVELGTRTQVESRFQPGEFGWNGKLFRSQGQVTYEFTTGDEFDPGKAWVAITSKSSLDRGARTLESPLLIEKWDKEQ